MLFQKKKKKRNDCSRRRASLVKMGGKGRNSMEKRSNTHAFDKPAESYIRAVVVVLPRLDDNYHV